MTLTREQTPQITREEIEELDAQIEGAAIRRNKVWLDPVFAARLTTLALEALASREAGNVVVPREPTQEMLSAVTATDQHEPFSDKTMASIYRAMISATEPRG